ncbi:MAG: transporter substrate-binding domain-containing protein [Synergistaceae bacterium]|nr:transporter substrate-binding domain-containing protein [Synergistaceae bacterium]
MKRALFLLAVVLVCSCAEAKTGVLAPMGQDENSIQRLMKRAGITKMDEIVIFDNLRDMQMALRAGRIDRFSTGSHTAGYVAMRNKDFGILVNTRNAIVGYSLAMLPANSPTMNAINSAIIRMKSDGTLERLVHDNIIKASGKDPIAVKMPKTKGKGVLRVAVTGDLPPMDCILADGTPAGFNTAFLAELSRRIGQTIELVSMSAGARQAALASGRVDAVFWTRSFYDNKRRKTQAIDDTEGLIVSEPYIFESRAIVSLKKD